MNELHRHGPYRSLTTAQILLVSSTYALLLVEHRAYGLLQCEVADKLSTGIVLMANPEKFCSRNMFSKPVQDMERFGLQVRPTGLHHELLD
eukprot:5099117-Pleurochrysis_carterae.AAC.2